MPFLDWLFSQYEKMTDYCNDLQARMDKYDSLSDEELKEKIKKGYLSIKDDRACHMLLDQRRKEAEENKKNSQ